MSTGLAEGWWFPINSRKAHYVVEADGGRSLCRRWAAMTATVNLDLDADTEAGPDDCAECRRRFDKRPVAPTPPEEEAGR